MKDPLKFILPIITGVIIFAAWYGVREWRESVAFHQVDATLREQEPEKFRRQAERSVRVILPTPGEIITAARDESETLLGAARTTVKGAVLGFISATTIGFLLALVLSSSIYIKQSFYPWVLIIQMVPVIILVPIFVLWLGPGLPAVVWITFMISFFPIVANTTQGLISTDRNMVDLFRMYNASKVQELLYLRVPYALPYYLTGVKIAATLATIGALTGELFAGSASGQAGLGYMVYVYNSQLKTAALFATAFTACGLGFLFVGSVLYFNWLLLHKWHDSMARPET